MVKERSIASEKIVQLLTLRFSPLLKGIRGPDGLDRDYIIPSFRTA